MLATHASSDSSSTSTSLSPSAMRLGSFFVFVGVAAAARPRNVVRDVKDTTKMGTTVSASDLLKLVNPFIGTTNGGNVFPGELQPTSNFTIC